MPVTSGLYYTVHEGGTGEQKNIILLHDAGSTHSCWPVELRRLPGYTIYALDLPGHGRSDGVGCQKVDTCCDRLIDFMASLGLYQAAFIGHGLGGAIALNMALDYSQHVTSLGMISSGASFNPPPELLSYLSSPVTTPAALERLQARMFTENTSPAVIRRSMEALKTTRSSVLYGDWLAMAQFDASARISEVKVPVYLACGSLDRLTPPSQSRSLSGMLPQAKLDLIDGAGHMLLLERPQALADGLKAFLDQQSAWQRGYTLPVELTRSDRAQVRKDSQ